ncbi:MAG: NAD(P)H-hydrate dehydratase [Pseudomonadota bacterium]
MTELLSAAQMRAMEKAAIDSGDVTGAALMARAGAGVVKAIFAEWPRLADSPAVGAEPHRATVLCGPGNNGGDGFVIARLLAARGWEVRAHLYGMPDKMPPDAKANHDLWAAQHPVLPMTQDQVYQGPRPDLLIDAVFGIGLSRPLPQALAEVLDRAAKDAWPRGHEAKTVAVDCPSGLDLDLGDVRHPPDVLENGPPTKMNLADLTVTFHAPKIGHYIRLGPTYCRKLVVVDIGLGKHGFEDAVLGLPPRSDRVRLVTPMYQGTSLRPAMWPGSHIGKQRAAAHKFEHGHAIVFVGGVGRGGAGRMAARAALRVGAGLVTVISPPAALIENACRLDAIMLRSLKAKVPLDDVVDDRATAFCMGPGMGVSEATRARVSEVLRRTCVASAWPKPAVVLDADALTSFEDAPEALFAQTHARTVLTPHEGEFRRLFPDLSGAARTRLSKVEAVRQAADRAGCIVLLKGADTVIAAPGGAAAVHGAVYQRAVPWLATAGAGDVLAGMIAGLAASTVSSDLFTMTEIAVWLHAEAARRFGPGLIAEDLPEALPGLFATLEL